MGLFVHRRREETKSQVRQAGNLRVSIYPILSYPILSIPILYIYPLYTPRSISLSHYPFVSLALWLYCNYLSLCFSPATNPPNRSSN